MGSPGGGKTATQTTVQSAAPPAYAQPYINQFLEGAQQRYESTAPEFYPGQTFVSPSSATETGLAATQGEALTGSPIAGLGNQEYFKTLRGDYTDPTSNPAFASMVEGIKANVLPRIDSRYIDAGREGSGLHGRAVGEGLGSAIGGLTYQNYEAERARQAAAMEGAPAYAKTRYDDINKLLGAGQLQEDYAGREKQDALARHDFDQNYGQLKLSEYGGNIGKAVFGADSTTTQTTPYFKGGSAASGAAGGALAGGSTGAAFGPYGALIGAGVGAGAGAASSK